MRHFFILLLILIFATVARSQTNRILGDFAYQNQVYTYEFVREDTDIYSLQISRSAKLVSSRPESQSASVVAGVDTTTKLIFDKFIKEEFVKVFKNQMQTRYNEKDTTALKELGTEIFFRVKAKREFTDDSPITAYLVLKRDTIYSFVISRGFNGYRGNLKEFKLTHKIHDIQVETEDGTVKNISVKLIKNRSLATTTDTPRDFLIFKNLYPISISGKFDQDKISDVYLYCIECGGIPNVSRYIKLGDLAILDIIYENDKDDYSPANSKIHLSPNNPIEELRKERRSKIIEAAVFTDTEGLRNDKPNGLIQIEAKRRFNLWTKHFAWNKQNVIREASALYAYEPYAIRSLTTTTESTQDSVRLITKSSLSGDKYSVYQYESPLRNKDTSPISPVSSLTFTVPNIKRNFTYYNWLGGCEFKLLFAKLEENKRYLSVRQQDGVTSIKPIDWYRYQLITLGGQLNVLRLVFPQTKLTWNCFQLGAFWQSNSIVRTTDISRDTLNFVSSAYYQLSTGLLFRPDGRFGASVGIDYIRPKIWEPSLELSNRGGLVRFNLDVYIKPNDNNRIFARARFTREITHNALDYSQLQVGYQFDIFQGTKDPKKFEP